jgi:glycolate dehydrogenase FAD-binding subunit
MENFDITTAAQVEEVLNWALSSKQSLEIAGSGSKSDLGHEMQTSGRLSLKGLAGIDLYEPAELVMRAKAGTRLVDIQAHLAEHNQRLAFSPPDLGPLLGQEAGLSTLGGVFACNLSGSSRIKAGAARDHLLGVNGFTGRGQAFQTGSRVMKNVTGYDLCKLVAGSYGTLAVCTNFTFKVLPKPEKMRTILIYGQEANAAVVTLRDAMSSIHEVAATAYLPANIAKKTGIDFVSDQDLAVTAILIDGAAPSVEFRNTALQDMFADRGLIEELHGMRSDAFWTFVANGGAFVQDQAPSVWRISLPPSEAAAYMFRLQPQLEGAEYYLDWAGGLIWLSVPATAADAGAGVIRAELKEKGHATLIRAAKNIRRSIPVFQPQNPVVQKISEKIREGFDPERILNPGRMYPVR